MNCKSSQRILQSPWNVPIYFVTIAPYYEAADMLQKALKNWKNSNLRGRLHYELGRIYQDDLSQPGLARFHLEKARRQLKMKEFKEEVRWRLVKTLSDEKKESIFQDR